MTNIKYHCCLFIRIESAAEMELILEKIPESVKKRMADEERMMRKEESCLLLEREAAELWRLRQLQLTPVVTISFCSLARLTAQIRLHG